MKSPKLKDVMTAAPVTIDANAPLTEAQTLMQGHEIHHLPVTKNGIVESILTEQNLLHAAPAGHKLTPDEPLTVGDVCPSRAYIADINDPLLSVVSIMTEQHIGEVVVLDNGELAGLFTESDACRVLAQLLPELQD